MRKSLIATALLGAIWGAPLFAETLYSEAGEMAPAPLLAQIEQSGFQGWLAPLMSKVNQLPEIQAQQAKVRQIGRAHV